MIKGTVGTESSSIYCVIRFVKVFFFQIDREIEEVRLDRTRPKTAFNLKDAYSFMKFIFRKNIHMKYIKTVPSKRMAHENLTKVRMQRSYRSTIVPTTSDKKERKHKISISIPHQLTGKVGEKSIPHHDRRRETHNSRAGISLDGLEPPSETLFGPSKAERSRPGRQTYPARYTRTVRHKG